MTKKLTAAAVALARPGKKRLEIPDGGCPGLYLIIQTSGQKSWALRFRSPVERDRRGQRKAKKLTLGTVAEVNDAPPEIGRPLTLAGARAIATSALADVQRGLDPTHSRRIVKRAERDEGAATADSDVSAVFEKFMKRYARVHTRESSWRETQRIFDRRIRSSWRDRTIQSIAKRDIIELLDRVMDDGVPILANRVLAVVRRFFNWTVERDLLAVSPCAGIKPPAAESSRDRVLSDVELRALWQVADADGYPFGPMTKTLILTGQRLDEVRCLPWSEINLQQRMWSIPGARTKNGRDHNVPLSNEIVKIFNQIPRVAGIARLVFTTTGETPVSGVSKCKVRFDKQLIEALQKKDAKAKAPDRWTFHDIRRTMYSGLQRLGFPIEVAEAVVNHISGTRKGVAGVYGRHAYAAEKKAALEAWSNLVTEIVNPTLKSNVVKLRPSEAVNA